MNEVENHADWNVEGSEDEYDSDILLWDSDGSEGEVPVVSGYVKETAPSCQLFAEVPVVTGGTGHAKDSVSSGHPAAGSGKGHLKWKPVIDKTVQPGNSVLKGQASPGSTMNCVAPPPGASAPDVKKDDNESDADARRVPDMASKSVDPGPSAPTQGQSSGSRPRKRGTGSADKETKRMKRLLRNRVSAQQARERKKEHLSYLEKHVGQLEMDINKIKRENESLREQVSNLKSENTVLRKLAQTSTMNNSGGGGLE